MWMARPQRDVFPGCVCHLSPSQSGAAPKEMGIWWGHQSVAELDPQSYLQRGFLNFFPSFPKGHRTRQISWEMSQCCLLLWGLAAFAARVAVSDTSCHFQGSSLVPEQCLTSHPSRGACTVWWRRGNHSKAKLKHPTWVRGKKKEANQPHSGSLLRNILDLILAHQGWQKSLISSHAGNEFYVCVRKREFGPHLSYPSCFSYLRPWSIPPYLSPLFRAFHKTQCP